MVPGQQLSANFLGCYQAHTAEVRGIVIFEDTASIMVYSVGADHRIVVFKFDKKKNERMEFVKSISTETWNEPQCIMRSTFREQVTFIISGKDLRLYEWDENRCIKTTNGVQLKTPLRILKESVKCNKVVFFCNDKSIGMLRQPIDGNPYASVAITGSSTKLLDLDVCPRSNYLFTISENSSSGLMWSVNSNYLRKLERFGGAGLTAYSPLLEGGINGPEMTRLKENFYCVQLVTSSKPEVDTVLTEFIDVCDVSLLMRAMGFYPSESEVENMTHEMLIRDDAKLGHPSTAMTFDELVVLYVNHKSQVDLRIDDVEKSFNYTVCSDPVNSCYDGTRVLTRESFVDMMINRGEKIDFREMEILLHILSKTTEDISPRGNQQQSIYSIHSILPFAFTFQEFMKNLLGFKNIEQHHDKNEHHRQAHKK
ncbi:cilia- and flagella-associated protein 251-like isoform X2 [Adelges cooleyi]|uniref:cilia- and flagella-associated protein 251-like isoform X2 n=1 Tax=Adelges cooleyi TaxID=133065 RepID=UPI00217F54A7|nr:cilia- and flagella-associated protein 251-like isoform X2 [Adelges cooleyi]